MVLQEARDGIFSMIEMNLGKDLNPRGKAVKNIKRFC